MSERLNTLRAQVIRQNEETPLFTQDSPESVARMIAEEAQELVEEITEAMVTASVEKVAGEMGDILYLLIKLEAMTGIDLLQATQFKVDRNEDKYGGATDRKRARDAWEQSGGDNAWIERRYYGAKTPRTRRPQLVYQSGASEQTHSSPNEERSNGTCVNGVPTTETTVAE